MDLQEKFEAKTIEVQVREYWKNIDLHTLLQKELSDSKRIGFVEGPPTMNGEPHVGHLRGRIIKDLWYRFSTLRKFNVIFRAGWDTQGLPVELQAEKELGLSGSKADNLKNVGIEKIVEQCKKLVHRYNEKWVEADMLLGMSFDYERAYWTYKDEYIEREWRYLKKAFEQGILVEGFQVVAYCPSCQTSLSHAEVSQGYETVEDPSLYYKVKLADEDAYLIVWTTMPFTVVTDEMVGVNPEADYLFIHVNDERWIVAQSRVEQLMNEIKIKEYSPVRKIKGSELDGRRYIHPLLDQIPGLKRIADKIHFVVAEDFVDIETGSGLVHLAPANGAEDFKIANARNIPIFNPIDDQVRFTTEAGIFNGMFVRDADQKVVESLKEKNAVVKIGRIKHEYPTCWRSHHKVVWLARREYFNMIDKLGDLAVQAAEDAEYFYNEPKNRFVGIIKEKVPWCVSRERVWGAPLPIWVCAECKNKIALFSRKEIVERAKELPDGKDFELHRPWIDRIVIRCEKCGADSYRESFVLDTWHNSGAAPYSSFTDEEYREFIPVPFLTEGIDQTRGWAYTLLIENVILNAKAEAPFRSFLFQGHVLDENGNKMSKSLGNVIDGLELLKNNPVDLIRFYFMWKANPIEALNFSVDEMKKRPYQILSTLYYLHVYFRQNSSYDFFDLSKDVEWAISNKVMKEPEIWLLSKLQGLIDTITIAYDRCRYHEAARAIEEFVINDLSQTYIPLTRNEIWDDSKDNINRRFAIYSILKRVLKTLDILLHPISPFITDHLYLSCFNGKRSILLEEWPTKEEKFVNMKVENAFDTLKEVVSVASAARMKSQLKRRWPLKNAYICVGKDKVHALSSLQELLRSQLNVNEIRLIGVEKAGKDAAILAMINDGLPVIPRISLKRSSIAPKVRADIGRVQQEFASINHVKFLQALQGDGMFNLLYDGKCVTITREDVEIEYETGNGYVMADRGNTFVLLSTVRDRDLTAKGLVRDIARRLQSLRKQRGYNPTDILDTAYVAGLDNEALELLHGLKNELAFLVRVKEVELMRDVRQGVKWVEDEIDGKPISISIE
ncbi:MAG: isoleucine--tRNA ligase [Nitrososphaerales archaeon]